MVAGIALSGRPVDGRSGAIWGVAGFAVISLAPALGLHPELPGALAADLGARQGWWLFCVAATGTGLWTLAFRQGAILVPAGVALMAIPHLIGAPTPERFGGPVSPELAAHFAAASLATAAIFGQRWVGCRERSGGSLSLNNAAACPKSGSRRRIRSVRSIR